MGALLVELNMAIKKDYLIRHTYDTGVIWAFVAAHNVDELKLKFPFLEVFESIPDAVSEMELMAIERAIHLSLDVNAEVLERLNTEAMKILSPGKDGNFAAQVFSKIAHAVSVFAELHRLFLEKNWHHKAMWRLRFAHPQGGQALIEITPASTETVAMQAMWWIDSFQDKMRRIKEGAAHVTGIDEDSIRVGLAGRFTEILGWQQDDWKTISPLPTEVVSGLSEKEFTDLYNSWPVPKL
jgi:hypothetical protein